MYFRDFQNKIMNQLNNFAYNFSEEMFDFDYSYGDKYMKDYDNKFDMADAVFGDNVPCFFSNAIKFDCDKQMNKNMSLNERHSFDLSYEPANRFDSLNDIKDEEIVELEEVELESKHDKNAKQSQPSRACSETNVILSFIQDEEQSQDVNTFSDRDCETEEISPEFEYECKYGDLNAFVDKLLSSNPAEHFKEQGIDVDDETIQKLSINKRKRKTKKQKELLENEYRKNPDWSKSFMQGLADQLGMSLSSIYKWHWDQRNKVDGDSTTNSSKSRKTLTKRKNTQRRR
jgi:hypothetical protein